MAAAAALLYQRADNLIQTFSANRPGNDEPINEIAREARVIQQQHPAQKQVVEQIFQRLAEARQWLENNPAEPHLAGRAARPNGVLDENGVFIPEPLPQVAERLIDPHMGPQLPPAVAAIAAPLLAALRAGRQPAPVAPVPPAPAPAPRPAAAQAAAPAAPQEATIWQRISALFTRCVNAVIDFIRTYLCRVPRTPPVQQQTPVVALGVAPPAPAAAPLIQQPVPAVAPVAAPVPAAAPLIQQPVPAAAPVAPPAPAAAPAVAPVAAPVPGPVVAEFPVLGAEEPQALGRYEGTTHQGNVGGAAVADNCARSFIDLVWDVVQRREDLSAPNRAQQLIDASLRDVAARKQQREGHPIVPIATPENGGSYFREIQILDARARTQPNRILAGTLGIGNDRHAILIDYTVLNAPRYYHFDPRGADGGPAALEICRDVRPFAEHLLRAVPIGGQPFQFSPYTL